MGGKLEIPGMKMLEDYPRLVISIPLEFAVGSLSFTLLFKGFHFSHFFNKRDPELFDIIQ